MRLLPLQVSQRCAQLIVHKLPISSSFRDGISHPDYTLIDYFGPQSAPLDPARQGVGARHPLPPLLSSRDTTGYLSA
jgi:hypothetical protein